MKKINRHGQGSRTILGLILIVVIFLIMFVALKNGWLRAQSVTNACKGSCIDPSDVCVGGTTVSGICYENGEVQEGRICCTTPADFLKKKETDKKDDNPPKDDKKQVDNTNNNPPPVGKAYLEIRKGLDASPVGEGTMFTLINNQPLELSFFTQRGTDKTSFTCTIEVLERSTGQLTNKIQLSPSITNRMCTDSSRVKTNIKGTFIPEPAGGWPNRLDQNSNYKLQIKAFDGNTRVAQTYIYFTVTQ